MMKNRLFFFVTLCLIGFLTSLGQVTKYDLNGDTDVNTADVVDLYNYIITGEVSNPVPAPANVKATVSGKTVIVSWAAVAGATYTVYRSADGKNFSVLMNNVTTSRFTDSTPLSGTNYYAVVSNTVDGASGYSTPAKINYTAGIESGLYLGVMCFNDEVYTQPISLLTNETKATFTGFIDEMTTKNATILCYTVDQAIDALKSASLPTDLSTVAMVTFTDGLDRASHMKNVNYETAEDYLADLKVRIGSEKVGGYKIDAYSIGLRGNDITTEEDIAGFKSTLKMLTSSDANAKEVSNMAEVNAKFQEIAEKLTKSVNRQTLALTLSGVSKGTRIRFTLDNASSAETSTIYIEGTFDFETSGGRRVYKLTDIKYNGMTTSSGTEAVGAVDGVYVTFSFVDIVTKDNRMLVKSQFGEWDNKSDSHWQRNSEWDPNQQPDVVVEKTSAVIMLVLDCSSSLGSQFTTAKTNAKNFISKLLDASSSGNDDPTPGPGPTPSDGTYTVNGVSFKMIPVEGGTFQMGSNNNWEKPVHSVTLSSFSIGETEVTQALWKAVMGTNPSNWQGDNLPVEKVSWNDCQTFITKLNQLTGETFRLPTEAEWEFAAKGGNKSNGYTYSGSNTIGDVAWYDGNSSSKTHPVATKSPNELGIYDMSGNVWEWCQDWYGSYSSSAQTNPTGPTSGSYRVYRGASWSNPATYCRTAYRVSNAPTNTSHNLGLRLAR